VAAGGGMGGGRDIPIKDWDRLGVSGFESLKFWKDEFGFVKESGLGHEQKLVYPSYLCAPMS